jgi:hypothetical protein
LKADIQYRDTIISWIWPQSLIDPVWHILHARRRPSPRQARRYVAELEAAGLVTRIERRAAYLGKLSNEYDLSGLVKRLQQLELEFWRVEEENKARRRAIATSLVSVLQPDCRTKFLFGFMLFL